ncbi:hypothetical protein JL722_9583 [Aureococcus anophagefferens]|nr:hypothetical protein JL722_9583 [Aureococcus anophagefferens]
MLPLPQDLQFKVAEFVTGRLPLANVREVRPGRRSYVRFAPHEDRAAPTSFLVSAGARIDERLVRELAVHHSVVAVVADAPSTANELSLDLYAVYQEFSGESTNRTLTSINVLVAFDLGASLAVRLCSRFTRNCVDALFAARVAAGAVAPRAPELLAARRRRLSTAHGVLETAEKHWPRADAFRNTFQPSLVVIGDGSRGARAEAAEASRLLVDSEVVELLEDDPRKLAALIVRHADRVLAKYAEYRRRSSAGFVLDTSKEDAALVKCGADPRARAELAATG